MATIQQFWARCKPYIDDLVAEWGLFAVVVLCTLGAFGLGRLSALVEARPLIALSEAPMRQSPEPLAMGGLYVASYSGSVYYYPWCSGAQKIAPQNQRWFPDEASARRAGYTPSKSCQGL